MNNFIIIVRRIVLAISVPIIVIANIMKCRQTKSFIPLSHAILWSPKNSHATRKLHIIGIRLNASTAHMATRNPQPSTVHTTIHRGQYRKKGMNENKLLQSTRGYIWRWRRHTRNAANTSHSFSFIFFSLCTLQFVKVRCAITRNPPVLSLS